MTVDEISSFFAAGKSRHFETKVSVPSDASGGDQLRLVFG